jgi:2-polyprenyl-3-methyl-5-hydroxy-6-metoxy-1,4-benzoquinol methylase
MIQATRFHKGMHVNQVDIFEAMDSCPVCASRRPRKPVFNVQHDPDINMLACSSCGACSASHMPTPQLLNDYYAKYYADSEEQHTFHSPARFARHLLRSMPDLAGAESLRILDFGGGDGSLSIAVAAELKARASAPMAIAVDVVDYAAPRATDLSGVQIEGYNELDTVEGPFDLILASAILEHIPDAYSTIVKLSRLGRPRTYMYARTPFVLPLAKLLPVFDLTYPAHVHDMGGAFWNRFIGTFGLSAKLLSSRPSLVETTLRNDPSRTIVATVLKLPALLETSLFGVGRTPRWNFVGGWEVVVQFH